MTVFLRHLGCTEQFDRRADARSDSPARSRPCLRAQPRLGLLEHEDDRHDEEGGHDADEEERPPAAVGPEDVVSSRRNGKARKRADDVPQGRQRLERAERHGAKCRRHTLRHQRRRGAEHPADAEADEKPVNREVHPGVGEPREPREPGVDHQRDHHRLHAPEPIAHHPEDDAARRPAEDHRRRGIAAERLDRLCDLRISGEQFPERGLPREDEQPLVHAVEQPSARGDDHDEPVIGSDALEYPPLAGLARRALCVHADPSGGRARKRATRGILHGPLLMRTRPAGARRSPGHGGCARRWCSPRACRRSAHASGSRGSPRLCSRRAGGR